MNQSPDQSFSLGQRLGIQLITLLGWMAVWLVNSTLRFQVRGWEHFQQCKARGPVIFSFWHNQIFMATYFWRFRDIVVITSRHFDGEYIARIIERFGYGAARGSSSRGAVKALLALKRHLEEGTDVAFTIDGPRGPAYRVKPGPLWLSRKTGVPVLPFHIEPQRYWQLRTWDRFRIPRPFSPVLVTIGRPFVVPEEGEEEIWTAHYQQEMDRIREWSEVYWRGEQERLDDKPSTPGPPAGTRAKGGKGKQP